MNHHCRASKLVKEIQIPNKETKIQKEEYTDLNDEVTVFNSAR